MKPEDKFRKKGCSILNRSAYSMKDFIEDNAQNHTVAQLRKTSDAQSDISTNQLCSKNTIDQKYSLPDETVERLHVQIRKDLADKLIKLVYMRKLSEKKASQRRIIEQALEEYFHNHK